MNCLKHSTKLLQVLKRQNVNNDLLKKYRHVSPCQTYYESLDKKDCFDSKNLVILRGDLSHASMVKEFLCRHYWPREPSVTSVWMDMKSPYLAHKTECYATSGDRLIALERIGDTDEGKMVGFAVSNKVYPWVIDELEDWAHYTECRAEKNRMFLCAHFLKSPNLFKKYKVDFIYEVECISTLPEVEGLGVGSTLLKYALDHALDARYPLVQVIAVNLFTSRMCEKAGMKKDWEMRYKDLVDPNGQQVFFPRAPHHSISIYTRYMDPKVIQQFPCEPPMF